MKQTFTKYFFTALLMSAMTAQGISPVASQVRIRPQGVDIARRNVLTVPGSFATHLADMDESIYGDASATFAYSRSMNAESLAREIFGDSLISMPGEKSSSWFCNKGCDSSLMVKIQGSDVENRDAMAWRANDFYLGIDFDGTLAFKPTISNFIVDLNLRVGFERWLSGAYFRLYGPFVSTKWDLKVTETVNQVTDSVDVLKNAQSFFSGDTPPESFIEYGPDGTEVNVIQNPLRFHKMLGFKNDSAESCEKSCGTGLTRNGFGELRADFGWDFLLEDTYHVGIYLTGAAPTGPKVSAQYLFGPQIGNGKKWELGAGFSGHYLFWQTEDGDSHAGIYSDIAVTHLFKSRENRVFDLAANGPMSRYMLAARMVSPTTNGLQGSTEAGLTEGTDPVYQFGNEFMPVANLTAQDVNVSIGAQIDWALWFNYTICGFTADLGYNLWFQSCERISCSDKCGPQLAADKNTWALVGDSSITGIAETDQFDYAIPFSQSKATISTGANGLDFTNAKIDNPQHATIHPTDGDQQLLGNGETPAEQIFLSSPVKFLSASDINMEQKTSAISHSVYGSLGYVVQREEGIEPFFGLGGKVEFGTNNKVGCEPKETTSCDSNCHSFAVSQWEVFGKIGILWN